MTDERIGIWSRAQQGHLPPTETPRRVLILGADSEVGNLTAQAAWLQGHACESDPPSGADGPGVEVVISSPLLEREEGGAGSEELAARRFERVAAAVAELGPGRLILMSGIEAAGPLPFSAGVAYEGREPAPDCDRGRALLRAEREAAALCSRLEVSLVVLRAGQLYSRGSTGALTWLLEDLATGRPDRVHAAWADHPLQPLHVEDLARAAVLAIDRGDWILHMTDHTPRSLGDLATGCRNGALAAGLRLPALEPSGGAQPAPGRVHYLYPDHRARRELGWYPLHDLADVAAELLRPLVPGSGQPETGQQDTPDAWARRLKNEWQERAQSPNRDFYVASHQGWQVEAAWNQKAREDTDFVLHGLDPRDLERADVLEIGCGVGRLARWIAPRVASYSGVDIAPGMVEQSRTDLAGQPNARFHVGDGASVPEPLRDRHYSLVICVAVFIHCPRVLIRRMLEDAWSLVAPGGRLRFQVLADPTDLSGLSGLEDGRVIVGQARDIEALLRPPDAERHVDATYYMGHRFSPGDLRALLEELALEQAERHRLDPLNVFVDVLRPRGGA